MYQTFESLIAMPLPVIVLVVCAVWGLIAFLTHRLLVPWLCGSDGRKLGRFEAEVTSQIALAFGLLLSFNAVWLWDRSDRVRGAVIDEANALQEVLDDADLLGDAAASGAVRVAVRDYATHLIDIEWPTLADSNTDPSRPERLVELRRVVRGAGGDAMLAVVKSAEAARGIRIREGLAYMTPARWAVVFILGVLLIVSIGALHGDSPRGRVLALTLVTLAIGFCFAVLLAHARPFSGQFAIKPEALQTVIDRTERTG